MRKFLKWLARISFIALLGSILFPFYVRSRRPARQKFQITKTYAQSALDAKAMNVNNLTMQSVVVEGPCPCGCYGGILNQETPSKIKKNLPALEGYDGETTTLIWLYNVKPFSIVRRNDIWGEDKLTIHGELTNDGKNYYAVVPSTLTAPSSVQATSTAPWVYVEINE